MTSRATISEIDNAVAEDDPVTLDEACRIVFRNRVRPATLRAEAARGRLDIARVGRRDFVTIRDVREMWKKCRAAGQHLGSTLTQSDGNGLSETDRASSAQAALNQTVVALKQGLPNISGKNIPHRAARAR